MLKTEYKLTKEQAEFIKDLRINKEYSWRAVARDTKNKFPKMEIDSDGETYGNQLDGIALCDAAMRYFNDTIDDGWN